MYPREYLPRDTYKQVYIHNSYKLETTTCLPAEEQIYTFCYIVLKNNEQKTSDTEESATMVYMNFKFKQIESMVTGVKSIGC